MGYTGRATLYLYTMKTEFSTYFLPSFVNYNPVGVSRRGLSTVPGGLDWRECSSEFQKVYRRYCAAKRNINSIERQITHFCALSGRLPFDSSRAATSTPSQMVVKADLSDTKWVLVGSRKSSPFMVDFV